MTKPGDINPLPLRDRPFSHSSRLGVHFTATRCDLQGGVEVRCARSITTEEVAMAVAEMIGFHATNVFPELGCSCHYDNLKFTVKKD